MNVISKRLSMFCLVACTLGLLVSCASGSLPSALLSQANAIPNRISTLDQEIADRENEYARFSQSSDFGFYQPYADRENWNDFFDQAKNELSAAESSYNTEIKPLARKNKPEDAVALTQQLDRFNAKMLAVQDLSKKASGRIELLTEARDNPEGMTETAETQRAEITTFIAAVEPGLRQAQQDYPAKSEDIDGRLAPMLRMESEADAALAVVTSQLASLRSDPSNVDYALFGDSAMLIANNFENVQNETAALESKVGELYTDLHKVLIDMKVDYFVSIGRSSWSNVSDYNREKEYIYPDELVDAETYEYLVNNAGKTLATHSRTSIDRSKWDALGINKRQSWTNGHDAAEYWVNNWSAKMYHKYQIVNGTQSEETAWIEVTAEEFNKYVDALGMTVVDKSFGEYEEEASNEPTPPGLAVVGNEKYGRWENDPSTGRTRWTFFENYLFWNLLLNNRGGCGCYYRGTYDTWRSDYRGRRGYYGSDSANPVYGTRSDGVKNSTRYQNTSFSRSGGMNTVAPSVRSAGPASRGGGPGGSGK